MQLPAARSSMGRPSSTHRAGEEVGALCPAHQAQATAAATPVHSRAPAQRLSSAHRRESGMVHRHCNVCLHHKADGRPTIVDPAVRTCRAWAWAAAPGCGGRAGTGGSARRQRQEGAVAQRPAAAVAAVAVARAAAAVAVVAVAPAAVVEPVELAVVQSGPCWEVAGAAADARAVAQPQAATMRHLAAAAAGPAEPVVVPLAPCSLAMPVAAPAGASEAGTREEEQATAAAAPAA